MMVQDDKSLNAELIRGQLDENQMSKMAWNSSDYEMSHGIL